MKALRREFASLYRRAPLGTRVEKVEPRLFASDDPKQLAKVAVKAARPTMEAGWNPSGRIRSRITERFLRAILRVTVTLPSEWRQWKKRGSAENPDTVEARRNVERLRHKREIQQNNLRIVDSRYQRYGEQQAHGKMKRAGIFATKKRT